MPPRFPSCPPQLDRRPGSTAYSIIIVIIIVHHKKKERLLSACACACTTAHGTPARAQPAFRRCISLHSLHLAAWFASGQRNTETPSTCTLCHFKTPCYGHGQAGFHLPSGVELSCHVLPCTRTNNCASITRYDSLPPDGSFFDVTLTTVHSARLSTCPNPPSPLPSTHSSTHSLTPQPPCHAMPHASIHPLTLHAFATCTIYSTH
jgi:hypothetical protein